MPNNNIRRYRIIRDYNNQCGLESFVRRLIRHHIDSIYLSNKPQEHPVYGGNKYVGKDND